MFLLANSERVHSLIAQKLLTIINKAVSDSFFKS